MTCLSPFRIVPTKLATRRSMSATSKESPQVVYPLRFVDRIVSLNDWWTERNLEDSPSAISLLDLRPFSSCEKQKLTHPHLQVVPFPVRFLKERSFELPARQVEFSILVEEAELEQVEVFLQGPKNSSRQRVGKQWKVSHVLIDNRELWEQASDLGMLADSNESNTFPLPRLWQPDSMVEKVLLNHLRKRVSNGSLQIWDLASGAGRDVAFLAEELLATGNPYHVWGFDHRYNEKEKTITKSFLERRGVGSVTECIRKDLSSWDDVTSEWQTNKLAALFCVRFWKPDLVAAIATFPELASGTLFGVSHFCKPYLGAPWHFDHPSEKTVLERKQLHNLFQDAGWEIVYDEIAMDSDHGRTMIHFVAKKH